MSDRLTIAVRAWTGSGQSGKRRGGHKGRVPATALILDTETRIDIGQGLLYAGYVFCRWTGGRLVRLEEGLVYPDDLPEVDPIGMAVLRRYVADHPANVADLPNASKSLRLMPRSDFVEKLMWKSVYKGRATLVMFNAPFDLSRLAIKAGASRKRAAGGFSFKFWEVERYRPRITVKSIDSKRSLKSFTAPEDIDGEDLADLDDGLFTFRGNILDLRTLVFSLTNAGHTLKSAGEAFDIPDGKGDAPPHGVITVEHVDYCRRDVLATAELYEAVIGEFEKHPIDVQPTRIFSPATMAKGYLRAMGVQPFLERHPDFPDQALGEAMGAFYGGRAEVHQRRHPLPVQLVDFTSMYPTIVALCQLWPYVIADEIDLVDATEEVQAMLNQISIDKCFDPLLWPELVGVAHLTPDGDAVPIRAAYDPLDPSYTIGVNHLEGGEDRVYAISDLVASAILTCRAPTITKATRYVARGIQPDLQAVWLRGEYDIDPATVDPFKTATELRQRLKRARPEDHPSRCPCQECQSLNFLKVFANGGSYGIFAEIVRQLLPGKKRKTVTVHIDNGGTFTTTTTYEETPGEYFFAPIAACITAGARLMLALLEQSVTEAGGTWVFCDTDSMAIVATQDGGLIPTPGGDHTTTTGEPAVLALSTAEVETIRDRFTALNPYDPGSVPGTILGREPRGVGHCFAISAKRYVIYNPDTLAQLIKDIADAATTLGAADLSGVILKRSEHGLGHLLNPLDPDKDQERNWIDELWVHLLATELGLPVPRPDWIDLPALSRYSISSPHLLSAFTRWNTGRDWREQVKPFNFMLIAHVRRLDRPVDATQAFQLVGPYSRDPGQWRTQDWTDRGDPTAAPYRITTEDTDDEQRTVRVRTYADYVTAHVRHPESKFNGPDGQTCSNSSVGQLARRNVIAAGVHYIGKEADRLEEVSVGLIANLDQAQTTYHSPDNDFQRDVTPILRLAANQIVLKTARQLHPDHKLTDADLLRTLQRARAGATPRALRRRILTDVASHLRAGPSEQG